VTHSTSTPQRSANSRTRFAARLSAALDLAGPVSWNVVRLEPSVVGLLLYSDFETDPFPALAASTRVELDPPRVKSRQFRQRGQPAHPAPKELLTPKQHPEHSAWAILTAALESRGLSGTPTSSGVAMPGWAGLQLPVFALKGTPCVRAKCRNSTNPPPPHGNGAPRPVAADGITHTARAHQTGVRVFDYGCGQGDDLRSLRRAAMTCRDGTHTSGPGTPDARAGL